MKLFLALLLLVGGYLYFLMHTTDTVLGMTKQLQNEYTYVANNADQIATGAAKQ